MGTAVKALRSFVFFSVITGFLYPMLILAVAKVAFKEGSMGSLVYREGALKGSMLLAQKIEDPAYFWYRPSAGDYGTLPSKASQLSPASHRFVEEVAARKKHLGPKAPSLLLTTSASGLDPHLSLEDALFQVETIARKRMLKDSETKLLKGLIHKNLEDKTLGIFGSRRVNVMALNIALDESFPQK
jgi:K+-transporting ATPase ATPase C chain